MSPNSRRSTDEMFDMLCPICEDDCSCAGQTELHIKEQSKQRKQRKRPLVAFQKGSQKKKVKTTTNRQSKGNSTQSDCNSAATLLMTDVTVKAGTKAARKDPRPHAGNLPSSNAPSFSGRIAGDKVDDLDVQYALSEYYFSEVDEEENRYNELDDSELLAEYYGYSSGSDIAIESLFLHSDSSDDDTGEDIEGAEESEALSDELDEGPLLFQAVDSVKTQEESLSEQLAKITPQILAAISMASKNLSVPAYTPLTAPPHRPQVHEHDEHRDTCLRLEELMDTKKLSKILSTSPPQDWRPPQRRIPLDAFRRRRSSITQITGALRAASGASITLAPEWRTEQTAEGEGQADHEDNSSESLEDGWLPVTSILWSLTQ